MTRTWPFSVPGISNLARMEEQYFASLSFPRVRLDKGRRQRGKMRTDQWLLFKHWSYCALDMSYSWEG